MARLPPLNRPCVPESTQSNFVISKKISDSGFTLIEILIVLGILAAVMLLGLGRIKKNENNIRTTFRELTVLTREIRNQARLTQSYFRLMIEMTPEKSRYWVEKGNSNDLKDPKEEYKIKKEGDSEEEGKKSSFELYKKLTKKEKILPKGISFKSLEIQNSQPLTDGLGAIYFSPEGLVEASIVQISDGKNIWSLYINPLTGIVEIADKEVILKDVISK